MDSAGPTSCGSRALRDQLKVALAVAITARKKESQHERADWKKKALAARYALTSLSKTLKALDPSASELSSALLQQLRQLDDQEHESEAEKRLVIEQSATRMRSVQLAAFVESTQVRCSSWYWCFTHLSDKFCECNPAILHAHRF
jgi:hypothetical protein